VLIIVAAWSTVAAQGLWPGVGRIERKTWLILLDVGRAHGCVTAAIVQGNASRVSPLDKVSLVFAIVLATVFLREKLNWQVAAGAALMVGSAVVIALSEPSE